MTDGNSQGDRGNVIAIDEAMQRWHAEADDEDAQLGLFAEPATEAGRARLATYRRGPGRPPGSRNKRTERTVAFLLSRHRDPREVLLELAEANVADLAGLLGCSLFEAAQEKRLAAIGVLPYIASRQPLAIDVTKRSLVYLTINQGRAELAAEGEGIGCAVKVIDAPEFVELPAADNETEEEAEAEHPSAER
jgi:hypothetical protein